MTCRGQARYFMRHHAFSCAASAALGGFAFASFGQPDLTPTVLADYSTPVPGLAGELFNDLLPPVIDDTGAVTFFGQWDVGTGSDTAVVHASADGLERLLTGFELIADPAIQLRALDGFEMSRAGLGAGVVIEAGVSNNIGVLLRLDASGFREVYRRRSTSPVTEGELDGLTAPFAINRAGDVAFAVALDDTAGAFDDDQAIILFDKSADAAMLRVREGDADGLGGIITGTDVSTGAFRDFQLGDDGAIVFSEGLSRERIALSRPGQAVGFLATEGATAPFGDAITNLSAPAISNDGTVVFAAAEVNSRDLVAIGSAGAVTYGRYAGPAPEPVPSGDDLGVLQPGVRSRTDISDNGLMVLTGNTSVGDGIFLFDRATFGAVARQNFAVPGGGVFDRAIALQPFTVNGPGQVLFRAEVADAFSPRTEVIFLFTPNVGTVRVVSEGDVIDGRTVASVGDLRLGDQGAGSLNNAGEVALLLVFTDGSEAIVRFGPAGCAADLTPPSDSLDIFDVLAYLALFDAGDPAADLASPAGVFDIFDVLAYLTLFDEGC